MSQKCQRWCASVRADRSMCPLHSSEGPLRILCAVLDVAMRMDVSVAVDGAIDRDLWHRYRRGCNYRYRHRPRDYKRLDPSCHSTCLHQLVELFSQ